MYYNSTLEVGLSIGNMQHASGKRYGFQAMTIKKGSGLNRF